MSRHTENGDLVGTRHTIDHVPGRFADRFDPRPDAFVIVNDEALHALGARTDDWLAVRTGAQPGPGDLVLARGAEGRWECRQWSTGNHDLTVAGVVVGALIALAS